MDRNRPARHHNNGIHPSPGKTTKNGKNPPNRRGPKPSSQNRLNSPTRGKQGPNTTHKSHRPTTPRNPHKIQARRDNNKARKPILPSSHRRPRPRIQARRTTRNTRRRIKPNRSIQDIHPTTNKKCPKPRRKGSS